MSGLRAASHAAALSIRCLMEFTFHVAMRIRNTEEGRTKRRDVRNGSLFTLFLHHSSGAPGYGIC
jgi:hypothetical protein